MWQNIRAKQLKNEIETSISFLNNGTTFHSLVKEAITKSKRGLTTGTKNDKPWPLLPLVVCEAISGKYKHALPAAAALQLYMAAGDVFDDIEDADSPVSIPAKYGTAIAINIATALFILAEKAITLLRRKGIEPSLIIRVIEVVNSLCNTACVGQYLDLSPTSEASFSEDIYLRVIGMKSASQVECACHVGAILATEDQDLWDAFAKFGYNLGIASQIANDIQGITHGSDIIKPKVTLPVIYALSQVDGEDYHRLKSTFSKNSEHPSDSTEITNLLFNTGAIHYTAVKMELYKQKALDILSKVEAKIAHVERLKLFLK